MEGTAAEWAAHDFTHLNPSGFARMRRRVVEDDQDLNRSFGFDEPASLSQSVAKTLAESVFRHCQFGIDLHDAGGRAVLVVRPDFP